MARASVGDEANGVGAVQKVVAFDADLELFFTVVFGEELKEPGVEAGVGGAQVRVAGGAGSAGGDRKGTCLKDIAGGEIGHRPARAEGEAGDEVILLVFEESRCRYAMGLVLFGLGPFGAKIQGILGLLVVVTAVIVGAATGIGEQVTELASHAAG